MIHHRHPWRWYPIGRISSAPTQVKLYPNPNNGSFTVTMPETGNYRMIVTSLIGSKVHEQEVLGQQNITIQLQDHLPDRSYFVEVKGGGYNEKLKFVLIR